MNKIIKANIVSVICMFIFAAVAFLLPVKTFAATVYTETSRGTVSVGDVFIVAIKVNTEGAVLNTVDGEITLKGNAVLQEFSLANSSFGLWPRTPSLMKDGKTVSFVGGVPGGFSIEGATIFKIIVEAKKEGVVTIAPQNISVFLNDGKGTKIPVQLKGLNINVVAKKSNIATQNDWANLVSKDTTPPEDFIIVPGQESNLYSGKKFVYFSAIDNQSGIDHYEVSENSGPIVKTGSVYVIQNQDQPIRLTVTAYDKAGNKKVSVLEPDSQTSFWSTVIVFVVFLIIAFFIYRKFRRSKKNNASTDQSLM
jgi:hypothetical protein